MAAVCCIAAGGVLAPPRAEAQSLMDRPPNLAGGWVGNNGQLYFNFAHRFSASDAPERKVSNFPTFTMAAGLPYRLLLGANYATNSTLAPRFPNEWEFFLRGLALSQDQGAPVDLAGQVAYNLAADGVDGEVTVAHRTGALRLVGVARVLADPFEAGGTRFAAGGGATFAISRYLSLAGDVVALTDRSEDENVAWGAGLHIAIPHTPHTFSLQAANTNNNTLQSSSVGEDEVRYGFEFTVPLTLARWFGRGAAATPPAGQVPTPPPAIPAQPREQQAEAAPAGPVVRASMRNLAYTPTRIEIAAGTTVEWTNNDPLDHTVTAVDRSFDSGLIGAGKTWRHTFTQPGSYEFLCTPHPFMKGVVVVR